MRPLLRLASKREPFENSMLVEQHKHSAAHLNKDRHDLLREVRSLRGQPTEQHRFMCPAYSSPDAQVGYAVLIFVRPTKVMRQSKSTQASWRNIVTLLSLSVGVYKTS